MAQLRKGLVGVAIDDHTQEFVVVTDPTLVQQAPLERGLSDAVGGSLTVRVQSGCFSADRLVRAHDVISSRGWHPDARTATFAFELDAHDSRWHATFDKLSRAVGAALKERLGSVVVVSYANKAGERQSAQNGATALSS